MIGPDLRSSAFQVLSALAVPENRSRCMIYRGRCMIYRALQRCTYYSGDGGMATLFFFVFVRAYCCVLKGSLHNHHCRVILNWYQIQLRAHIPILCTSGFLDSQSHIRFTRILTRFLTQNAENQVVTRDRSPWLKRLKRVQPATPIFMGAQFARNYRHYLLCIRMEQNPMHAA